MGQIAFISDLTYRSKEQQIKEICAFYDCLPSDLSIYDGPQEIPTMLRPTRRNGYGSICMSSLAVLAANRQDFTAVARKFNTTAAKVVCIDDQRIKGQHKLAHWVSAWQQARKRGAAKAGGEESARRAEIEFWEKFAAIKDRWHLPSKKANANKPLLSEARIGSRATVKSYLNFTREEWQRMPENKRKRILERAYVKTLLSG